MQGIIESTGSSGFADDTLLHTDGPDAVPAMAILVTKTADYLRWAGMDIHMKKYGITAMDMRSGQRVATDSITLRGQPSHMCCPAGPARRAAVLTRPCSGVACCSIKEGHWQVEI